MEVYSLRPQLHDDTGTARDVDVDVDHDVAVGGGVVPVAVSVRGSSSLSSLSPPPRCPPWTHPPCTPPH